MSLSKFAHLANSKNDALQIAYFASMRCKSMPKTAFDILQTVHSVKTQKRYCQSLRFIKCTKTVLVIIFALLANTENAFDNLQNAYFVKTQKRHCQNLRFI